MIDDLSAKEFHSTVSSPDDVFVLPYSSGTSGLPKGVQLTHKNIVSNLLQFKSANELKITSTRGFVFHNKIESYNKYIYI